ncbi:MAG: four helix bundle protein [Rhodospirillaceae bacterium]
MSRKHHDLVAWKEALSLVTDVYRATSGFPREEAYGLTGQMRRAAVSVPANIAEGAARNTDKEFLQFLHIARGSLSELETHTLIARNLGYLMPNEELSSKIRRSLGSSAA